MRGKLLLHYRSGVKPIYSCGLMEEGFCRSRRGWRPDSLLIPYGRGPERGRMARVVNGTDSWTTSIRVPTRFCYGES